MQVRLHTQMLWILVTKLPVRAELKKLIKTRQTCVRVKDIGTNDNNNGIISSKTNTNTLCILYCAFII
jgi:hypothetical protein